MGLPRLTPKIVISSFMGLTAGYVDVICVIRYGAFVVTMTGNVIFLGSSFRDLVFGDPQHVVTQAGAARAMASTSLVIASGLLGAYAYAAFHHRHPKDTAKTAAPFLASITLSADLIGSWRHIYWAIVPSAQEPAAQKGVRWIAIGGTTRYSMCLVAFSFGCMHYLSNSAEDSRLKAPAFAATGHLHKLVKALWAKTAGRTCYSETVGQSMGNVLGLLLGALLGACALAFNPFDNTLDGDAFLLLPVALAQYALLRAIDECIPPPGGWPAPLIEPLTVQPA